MAEAPFLWVEKYRPKTIKDCVLSHALKAQFEGFVRGEIPNLILCGSAGTGKTTVARAMVNEVGGDLKFVNASSDAGIDMLRTEIRNFASTVSLSATAQPKYVILDEADGLSNTSQQALRGMIEEFHNNCRLILTCNYKNRIIKPLHSRCSVIDFAFDTDERPELAAKLFEKVRKILDAEKIKYNKMAVIELITKHFPDFRRIIGELQRYSASGEINSGILLDLSEESLKELVNMLKTKNFTKLRRWVADNSDADASIYQRLYEYLAPHLVKNTIPHLILLLAEYQYKAAFVANQEINMLAMLTEIMGRVEVK